MRKQSIIYEQLDNSQKLKKLYNNELPQIKTVSKLSYRATRNQSDVEYEEFYYNNTNRQIESQSNKSEYNSQSQQSLQNTQNQLMSTSQQSSLYNDQNKTIKKKYFRFDNSLKKINKYEICDKQVDKRQFYQMRSLSPKRMQRYLPKKDYFDKFSDQNQTFMQKVKQELQRQNEPGQQYRFNTIFDEKDLKENKQSSKFNILLQNKQKRSVSYNQQTKRDNQNFQNNILLKKKNTQQEIKTQDINSNIKKFQLPQISQKSKSLEPIKQVDDIQILSKQQNTLQNHYQKNAKYQIEHVEQLQLIDNMEGKNVDLNIDQRQSKSNVNFDKRFIDTMKQIRKNTKHPFTLDTYNTQNYYIFEYREFSVQAQKIKFPPTIKVKLLNGDIEIFVSKSSEPSWSNFDYYYNVFDQDLKIQYQKSEFQNIETLYFTVFAQKQSKFKICIQSSPQEIAKQQYLEEKKEKEMKQEQILEQQNRDSDFLFDQLSKKLQYSSKKRNSSISSGSNSQMAKQIFQKIKNKSDNSRRSSKFQSSRKNSQASSIQLQAQSKRLISASLNNSLFQFQAQESFNTNDQMENNENFIDDKLSNSQQSFNKGLISQHGIVSEEDEGEDDDPYEDKNFLEMQRQFRKQNQDFELNVDQIDLTKAEKEHLYIQKLQENKLKKIQKNIDIIPVYNEMKYYKNLIGSKERDNKILKNQFQKILQQKQNKQKLQLSLVAKKEQIKSLKDQKRINKEIKQLHSIFSYEWYRLLSFVHIMKIIEQFIFSARMRNIVLKLNNMKLDWFFFKIFVGKVIKAKGKTIENRYITNSKLALIQRCQMKKKVMKKKAQVVMTQFLSNFSKVVALREHIESYYRKVVFVQISLKISLENIKFNKKMFQTLWDLALNQLIEHEQIAVSKQVLKRQNIKFFTDYIQNQRDTEIAKIIQQKTLEYSNNVLAYLQEINKLEKYSKIALLYMHELGYQARKKKYTQFLRNEYEDRIINKKKQQQDSLSLFNKYSFIKESYPFKVFHQFRESLGLTKGNEESFNLQEFDQKLFPEQFTIQEPYKVLAQKYPDFLFQFQLIRPKKVYSLLQVYEAVNDNSQMLDNTISQEDSNYNQEIQQSLNKHSQQILELINEEEGVQQNIVSIKDKRIKKNPNNTTHINESKDTIDETKLHNNLVNNTQIVNELSVLNESKLNQSSFTNNSQQEGSEDKYKQLRKKFKGHNILKQNKILRYKPYYEIFPPLKVMKEIILSLVDFPFQEFLIESKKKQQPNKINTQKNVNTIPK